MKDIVSIEDFTKLDIRVGTIENCSYKDGSDKLLRLTVNFGEDGIKNILSGIKQWYKPEELIGRQFIFLFNLAPRKMMGEFSEGMILAADGEKPIPLTLSEEAKPGSAIR